MPRPSSRRSRRTRPLLAATLITTLVTAAACGRVPTEPAAARAPQAVTPPTTMSRDAAPTDSAGRFTGGTTNPNV